MWHKFWRLSRRERRLFAGALVMLPIAALRLRSGGAAAIDIGADAPEASDAAMPPVIGEAARMVKAAARIVPGSPACLAQSIVVQRLLRREGVETAIRIGVRKHDGGIAAHAWVEYQGLAVTDSSGHPFTVLSR